MDNFIILQNSSYLTKNLNKNRKKLTMQRNKFWVVFIQIVSMLSKFDMNYVEKLTENNAVPTESPLLPATHFFK